MWSEQPTDQETSTSQVIESTIVGGGEEHVLVKLLTSNGGVSSSNGGEVLTKLLTGGSSSASSGAVVGSTLSVGTYVLTNFHSPGLRKIEPKPPHTLDEEEKDDGDKSGRFLGINATRRGVKTCPQCLKKIGYRSKQCKYCSPVKQSKRARKNAQSKQKNLPGKDEREGNASSSTVDISAVMVENETEVSTTEMPTSEEVPRKDVHVEDGLEVGTVANCEEESIDRSSNENIQGVQTESSVEKSSEPVIGKRIYQTSLQDLIHTLLAQNQSNSIFIAPDELQADQDNSQGHAANEKEHDQTNSSEPDEQETSLAAASGEVSPENIYDANSVALFLGHLAQQNGKKIRTVLNPVMENMRPSTSGVVGVKTKHFINDDESSTPAKYRKIRPKSVSEGNVDMQQNVNTAVEEEEGDSCGIEVKVTETQYRMLPGNATRRGVMPCQRCQSLIGCRSKVCKHCKCLLNETNPPYKRSRKQLRQAVQLHIPPNSVVTVYSVRRSKVGPDHRCFVWCEKSAAYSRRNNVVFSCDYPPCVTAKELGGKSSSYLCEHAKVCSIQSVVNKGKILELHNDKLSSPCFSAEVADSLGVLNRQCISRGVPLVQSVSDRMFVVVDQLQTEQNSSLVNDLIGFVHVRFERNKVNGYSQAQIVCSGRPCMAWNPVFSSSQNGSSTPVILRALNCIHYSACLWAITSDKVLQEEFGLYLKAAEVQVRAANKNAN